jgi:hypothetical protein
MLRKAQLRWAGHVVRMPEESQNKYSMVNKRTANVPLVDRGNGTRTLFRRHWTRPASTPKPERLQLLTAIPGAVVSRRVPLYTKQDATLMLSTKELLVKWKSVSNLQETSQPFHAYTVTGCSGPVSDSQVTYGPTKTNDSIVEYHHHHHGVGPGNNRLLS